jgi:hypothetical protein
MTQKVATYIHALMRRHDSDCAVLHQHESLCHHSARSRKLQELTFAILTLGKKLVARIPLMDQLDRPEGRENPSEIADRYFHPAYKRTATNTIPVKR